MGRGLIVVVASCGGICLAWYGWVLGSRVISGILKGRVVCRVLNSWIIRWIPRGVIGEVGCWVLSCKIICCILKGWIVCQILGNGIGWIRGGIISNILKYGVGCWVLTSRIII